MLPRTVRLVSAFLLFFLLFPAEASPQSVPEALNNLFVFGSGEQPLTLAGSPGVHGMHFIPSESEANGVVLQFFNNSIASNVSNFPLSSTQGSETFVFVGGVPEPTSTSFGPIFAERGPTLGAGRVNAGVNYSRLNFSEIRGVKLNDVQLTFVHDNVGDTTVLGDVAVENDVMNLFLDLDIDAEIFAFYATLGLTDWLDVSVAVPVVDLELRGRSTAEIQPSTLPDTFALHFFTGEPDDPVLINTKTEVGRSTGIGDIAGRIKVRITRSEKWTASVIGEIRAPTGDEEEFLGTGEVNAKGLFIASGVLGDFSPHTNIGFEYRGADIDQNEVEIIFGFDQKLADWATLAVDFLGAFKVGEQQLEFPDDVVFDLPFPGQRRVRPTNIPDIRDDRIDGSLGFKFQTGPGIIIITNILVPLDNGGLRSDPIPTIGLEYNL